jgi:hypothetical protein
MTNERHEKALEAAVHAFYGNNEFPPSAGNKRDMTDAIAAYLQAMDAVIVPNAASKEMELAAVAKVKPYHDENWYRVMPGDLFRLAWPAMLSKAPNHFTNGE